MCNMIDSIQQMNLNLEFLASKNADPTLNKSLYKKTKQMLQSHHQRFFFSVSQPETDRSCNRHS